MTATSTALPSVARLRAGALQVAAQGSNDQARGVLEAALREAGELDFEIVSDLAAMALRDGDLVRAIGLARQVLQDQPEHGSAQFTLALGLSAIGSYDEASRWLQALTEGETGDRFAREVPDLAAIAATELQRLRSRAPLATAPARGQVTAQFGTASEPGPSDASVVRGTADGNGKYDLSHLVQPANQNVGGPIQDDEAMALYSLVRTMRLRRVLEIGGLSGYSARNFLAALSWDVDTAVYTVDLEPVASQASNHFTLRKDVALLETADVHDLPLDLVFFDAHVLDAQMDMFVRLRNKGLITDRTVLALHDTGLHPKKSAPWSYPIDDANGQYGYVHQDVERKMVNLLRERFGYDAVCLHTDLTRNDSRLPFRHGLTIMQKFVELRT